MRCILIILLTSVNVTFLNAQFHAVLVDSITKEPIINANIRFEMMNIGTISNSEGLFQLDSNPNIKKNIIISHIGYESKHLYLNDEKDTIFLSPKTYKLDEVIVSDFASILTKSINKFSKVEIDELFHRMYYKQYLKQNENFVDYLEAIITYNHSKKDKGIYIESVRAKENKTANYIDFGYLNVGQLINYLNVSKLIESKILSVNFIDEKIAEILVDYKGKNLQISVDTLNNNIIEVVYNGINNQLSKPYDKKQKVWAKGKIRTFQSYTHGKNFKVIYDYNNEKPFIKFFKIDYKETLKSEGISLVYSSTQILQSIELTEALNRTKKLKKLNERKRNNLKFVNSKNLTPFSWNKTNKIYPTKNELAFLRTLKWE